MKLDNIFNYLYNMNQKFLSFLVSACDTAVIPNYERS